MTEETGADPKPEICNDLNLDCEVINAKPASNFYLARMDLSGTWIPVEDHCDENCHPPERRLTKPDFDAEVGDCAYFPCHCPEESGAPPQSGPVAP